MTAFNPREFIRPETLRNISPASLLALLRPHRRFFEAAGLNLPPARSGAAPNLQKLSAILAAPDLSMPVGLADALYYINEMSTPDGMDALLAEVPADELGLGMFQVEPADVAVRAWLKDSTLVERKHAEILASRPRRFQYFQSYDDPPPPLPEITAARLRSLESYLDAVFRSKGRGRGVRVVAYPRDAGCLFLVRHGDPRRREGALKGTEETSVLYRPLQFDVVGYDGLSGTLRVYAKSKWETSLYRGGFGLHLFGALDHFPHDGRYSLEPLRSGDPLCLACADAPPIKHVNLVEVQLHWGGIYDGEETYKATDVFAWLRQRQAEIPRVPRIRMAAFDVFLFGGRRPRRVTIVPPNIARYSHEDQSHLIDHWLGLRGFVNGGAHINEQKDPTLQQVR